MTPWPFLIAFAVWLVASIVYCHVHDYRVKMSATRRANRALRKIHNER